MGILLQNNLEVFKNIPLDILIGVAFLIVIAMISIICVMSRGRHVYQALAKITDLINNIRSSPLFNKIYHVSFIAERGNNLQTKYLRWRTIFEVIYEKKFMNLTNEFIDLIDFKQKKVKLSKKSLLNLIRIYDTLNNDVYNIQLILIDDINNHLEPERIYRALYVKLNNIYLHLLAEIDAKIMIGEFTAESAMNEIKININEAFDEFYSLLIDGRWDEIKPIADTLENYLTHLINMLDIIPHLNLETKSLIVRRMTSLKNQYVTFGHGDRIEERAIRYSELERRVDELRISINNHVKKLQYLKGKRILKNIYNLIDDYEAFASFEEGVQNKINIFSDEISEIFSRSVANANVLLKVSAKVVGIKNRQWDHFELQHLVTELSGINDRWILINTSFQTKSRIGTVNFEKVRIETINLIDSFTKNVSAIVEFEDKINKSSIDKSKLVDQIVICDALVNQIAVKIVQYHSVPSLKLLEPKVDGLRKQLSFYAGDNLNLNGDDKEIERIQSEIDLIYADAQALEMKVVTDIFYDYITQELIIYLGRSPMAEDEYEKFIRDSIEKKGQGKYLDVISGATKVIQQVRSRMKG